MQWGSTQEATSLLAVLNHFGRQGATLCEAGMYPLEAFYPRHEDLAAHYPVVGQFHDFPPIGASPGEYLRFGRRVTVSRKDTCLYPFLYSSPPCGVCDLHMMVPNRWSHQVGGWDL